MDPKIRDQINGRLEAQYLQGQKATPKTSHGMRNQIQIHGDNPNYGQIQPNQLGLNEYLDYDKGADYKKVQSAIPGKRQRRQIMTKSQNNSNAGGFPGSGAPTEQPGMITNIEQGKYQTEKDKLRDVEAVELANAQMIVQSMQGVEPFGDVPAIPIQK